MADMKKPFSSGHLLPLLRIVGAGAKPAPGFFIGNIKERITYKHGESKIANEKSDWHEIKEVKT
jgi:hypothetical protein